MQGAIWPKSSSHCILVLQSHMWCGFIPCITMWFGWFWVGTFFINLDWFFLCFGSNFKTLNWFFFILSWLRVAQQVYQCEMSHLVCVCMCIYIYMSVVRFCMVFLTQLPCIAPFFHLHLWYDVVTPFYRLFWLFRCSYAGWTISWMPPVRTSRECFNNANTLILQIWSSLFNKRMEK